MDYLGSSLSMGKGWAKRRRDARRDRHAFSWYRSPTERTFTCWGKPKENNHEKESTKDQIEGKAHEVKGAVKETIGNVVNNPNLEAEGQDEKIGGKVQKKVGEVEKVLGA